MPFYEVMKGPDPTTGLFMTTAWEHGPTQGSALALVIPDVISSGAQVPDSSSQLPIPALGIVSLGHDVSLTEKALPAINLPLTTVSTDTPLTAIAIPLVSSTIAYTGAEVV